MNDEITVNDWETSARKTLIETLQAMLKKELTYFEGSRVVLSLRSAVGDVANIDTDFNAFRVIYSETDHLPAKEQKHLWNQDALAQLKTEFEKTEIWADSFAPAACEKLIARVVMSSCPK